MPYEKSPAQRSIDWGKIIETAMDMPGNVGHVYNRFYTCSCANQALLWDQGAREPVASTKRWNALGRTVLAGSKAYEIIVHKSVRRIFTLSQTEGEELSPVELPEWDVDTALQKLGIAKVPFRRNDSNIQGYSYSRNIAINPFAAHPAKSQFHELGHVVLGHTTPEMLAGYEQHRGVMEFQAEATAHLAMNELGQLSEEMATHSRGYIQGWLRGERPPDKAIREVFTATDVILKAGRLAISPPEE